MTRDFLFALAAAVGLHAGAVFVLPAANARPPRHENAGPTTLLFALAPAPISTSEPATTIDAARFTTSTAGPARPPVPTSVPAAAPGAVTNGLPPGPVPVALPPRGRSADAASAPARPLLAADRLLPPIDASAAPAAAPAPRAAADPGPAGPAPESPASGGPTGLRRGPVPRENPPPAYPSLARRRGWEGLVVLRVEVLASGGAGAIEVMESSGRPVLDEAAIDAVQRWRFQPGTIDGAPARSWIELPVEFEIRD